MADSAPAPLPTARGRRGTSAEGGDTPPLPTAKARPVTSAEGGKIPPLPEAKGRKTSDLFENPGIPPTKPNTRKATRETPEAQTMRKVK